MKRLLALILAAWLGCVLPASAAVVKTDIGNLAYGATNVSNNWVMSGLTVTAGVPLIVGGIADTGGIGITVSDNIGGSTGWVSEPRYPLVATGAAQIWYIYNFNPPAGVTTLTINSTFASSGSWAAAQFTNVTARDSGGDGPGVNSGTSATTATDQSANTLAQADEVAIVLQSSFTSTYTNPTLGGGWAQIGSSAGNGLNWSWKETASTAKVSADPSWTPSAAYAVKLFMLKAGSAPAAACTQATTGAGSC